MKRIALSVLTLASVAACSPEVPDSAAGVGFGDYGSYQTARDAQLEGATPEVTVRPPSETVPVDTDAAAGDRAAVNVNNPSISDEQDFSAVSARESIESDRERLAAQREQYTFIEPTAVPSRAGGTGPNIVEYALSTTNSVGQPVYRRSGLRGVSSSQRACAKYASPDLAQIAFLQAGGPKRDRKNLDPDGDGFACSWDPAPFRLARGGQ